LRQSNLIIGFALASLVMAAIIVPTFGRIFLPEFQEQSLVNTLLLYPGSSLEATNSAASVLEGKLKGNLKGNPNIRSIQVRAGRASGDADAGGVNLTHLDVELSDVGIKDRVATVKMLRTAFNGVPGAAPNVGGFISHRMDEVLSGVRSAIAVKIFGADLVVWMVPQARQNLETIRNLSIDMPTGSKIPLAQVATIEMGKGANTINRENVLRLIVVAANAQGRDLRSVVNDIQTQVKQKVQIPAGYYIQYAGQFEAAERASQNILLFSAISAVVITVITYFSVGSIASTIAIIINLPLALVCGIVAVALTGSTLSIASLVGFVTLFGVATRNGLLLVDNYNTKFAQGMPVSEILIQGSMERLNAIFGRFNFVR
jgi:Cu/Ag efflux pump CusA